MKKENEIIPAFVGPVKWEHIIGKSDWRDWEERVHQYWNSYHLLTMDKDGDE